MKILKNIVSALCLVLLCFTTRVQASDFKGTVEPFFKKHCVSCHGPKKEKGALRVDKLTSGLDDFYTLDHLQNILDELITESMPPEDEPQADAKEVVKVIEALRTHLITAQEKHSSGGGKPVRRLSQTEYINTVFDLLGVHINPRFLPSDGTTGSFDTNAASLYTTDLHFEAYLEVSRDVVKRFIASRFMKPGLQEIPVSLSPNFKKSKLGFNAKNVPPAGHLKVQLKCWQRKPNQKNRIIIAPSTGESVHEVTGSPKAPQNIEMNFYEPLNTVSLKILESNIPSQKVIKGKMTSEQAKAMGKFQVTPETLVKAQDLIVKLPVILGEIKNFQVISKQPHEFFAPFMRKYGIKAPKPVIAKKPIKGRRKGKKPEPVKEVKVDQLPDTAAPYMIKHFAKYVCRGRELDPELLGNMNTVFLQGRKQGMTFWEAIVEPLAISMCSLEFMYHFESKSPEKETKFISGVELANRLSFLLWRSAPDRELVALGRAGKLLDPMVKSQQIDRMMSDKKFDRFLTDFTNQWLELERQDLIAVDKRIFPKFKSYLRGSMKKETVQFISHIVRKDLSLNNLIDSDFLVINNMMANHYGLPRVYGDDFRAVPRQKGDKRGGILTHAGILMQTGNGERTSIVERGVFVARKLINSEPPPPPPNVANLPTDNEDFVKLTAVELVKAHANTPQCASCHSKIDPIGVGLEEFDAIGLYRTVEKRLNPKMSSLSKREKRNANNLLLDVKLHTAGKLPNGQGFKDIEGLKKALLAEKHNLAEGFIEALLTFANGRKAGMADQAIVDGIIKRAEKSQYPTRSIIKAVLISDALVTN